MLERLVPVEVCVRESRAHRIDITLFPLEEAAVAGVVTTRRQEFTTVRACARDALAALGLPAGPIVPGHRGAPIWPAGVVGSMTHCAGYNAVALARSQDIVAIGIDAEPDEALPRRVVEVFASPDELAHLDSLPAGRHAWERLLFCAKESVFKARFPSTARWLDFMEVSVILRPTGTFTARLSVGDVGRWAKVNGRWLAEDGFLVTAVIIG